MAGAGLRLGEFNAGEGERGLLLHGENHFKSCFTEIRAA
jgi:hypothetical protein